MSILMGLGCEHGVFLSSCVHGGWEILYILTPPSHMLPQIPGQATVCGDIRVTPFYDVHEVGGPGSSSCVCF